MVDSEGMPLAATAPVPVEPGQPVTVVVRYERIGLGPGDTTLRAKVIERMFLGGTVRVVAELAGGRRVTADITSASAAGLPAIGEPVALSFNAQDSRVLVT